MTVKWQPVGTAPRDGTKIIGLNIINNDIRVAYYDRNHYPKWTDGSSCGGGMYMTHWMSLSDFPQSPQELYPEIGISTITQHKPSVYFIDLTNGDQILCSNDFDYEEMSFSYIPRDGSDSYSKTYNLSDKWNGDLTDTDFYTIFKDFLQKMTHANNKSDHN